MWWLLGLTQTKPRASGLHRVCPGQTKAPGGGPRGGNGVTDGSPILPSQVFEWKLLAAVVERLLKFAASTADRIVVTVVALDRLGTEQPGLGVPLGSALVRQQESVAFDCVVDCIEPLGRSGLLGKTKRRDHAAVLPIGFALPVQIVLLDRHDPPVLGECFVHQTVQFVDRQHADRVLAFGTDKVPTQTVHFVDPVDRDALAPGASRIVIVPPAQVHTRLEHAEQFPNTGFVAGANEEIPNIIRERVERKFHANYSLTSSLPVRDARRDPDPEA